MAQNTPTASPQRDKNPPTTNEYDTKQRDDKVPVMLEFWEMWSTPLLHGPLWPGEVAPDRVLSNGQIELNCVLMLNWTAWNKTVFTFNSV